MGLEGVSMRRLSLLYREYALVLKFLGTGAFPLESGPSVG
jgi:hypothetical protein